jgi:cysteine desulfuration protein SufE
MDTNSELVPARLSEIIDDFAISEGREKLELLLEYAESMPPLPKRLAAARDQMEQVHECMTPVFVSVENRDGRLYFYFDVPAESPTVRGYAAILGEGLQGATAEQILAVPNDFYRQMGLDQVLTHQRLNGITAMMAYLKRLALEAVSS